MTFKVGERALLQLRAVRKDSESDFTQKPASYGSCGNQRRNAVRRAVASQNVFHLNRPVSALNLPRRAGRKVQHGEDAGADGLDDELGELVRLLARQDG